MTRKLTKIPRRVYARYALLNLPGTLLIPLAWLFLRQWIAVPTWLFLMVIIGWVAKDIILFPFVWTAYDWNRPGLSRRMTGARGVAVEKLNPKGYVRIGGELWKAQIVADSAPIEKGKTVRIVRRRGLKLDVAVESNNELTRNSHRGSLFD